MTYKECDEFTQGYIKCALWLFDDDPGPGDWSVKEREFLPSLAPETIKSMADDCQKFQADNDDLLARAYGEDGTTYSAERAGHDFWLTRNGHGAGYWDRDLGAVGDSLTEKAHDYGDADLYRGDDGLIYVS